MLWGKQQWRGQKGSTHKCFPVLLLGYSLAPPSPYPLLWQRSTDFFPLLPFLAATWAAFGPGHIVLVHRLTVLASFLPMFLFWPCRLSALPCLRPSPACCYCWTSRWQQTSLQQQLEPGAILSSSQSLCLSLPSFLPAYPFLSLANCRRLKSATNNSRNKSRTGPLAGDHAGLSLRAGG